MRIFSYIFTALVTIFVINIALSFSIPGYHNALVGIRTNIFPTLKTSLPNGTDAVKPDETTRLVESLDRIDKHIESLTEAKKNTLGTGAISESGTLGLSTDTTPPQELNIPLSGLFLAKIMPDVMMKKTPNNGFFGIQIMEKLPYNTYIDERRHITVYAFQDSYDTLLLNMKLTGSVYSLNETDQFFGFTFFLNPVKKDPKDTVIRFVTALEGRAIGVEVPKAYYASFKKMLLKNK